MAGDRARELRVAVPASARPPTRRHGGSARAGSAGREALSTSWSRAAASTSRRSTGDPARLDARREPARRPPPRRARAARTRAGDPGRAGGRRPPPARAPSSGRWYPTAAAPARAVPVGGCGGGPSAAAGRWRLRLARRRPAPRPGSHSEMATPAMPWSVSPRVVTGSAGPAAAATAPSARTSMPSGVNVDAHRAVPVGPSTPRPGARSRSRVWRRRDARTGCRRRPRRPRPAAGPRPRTPGSSPFGCRDGRP